MTEINPTANFAAGFDSLPTRSVSPIDALLNQPFTWKNSDFPLGTGVRINVAFATTRPADWPAASFSAIVGSHQARDGGAYEALIRESMALLEASCGVDFVDSPVADARIVFGIGTLAGDTAGYAYTYYNPASRLYSTAVVYDNKLLATSNPKATITHEIGHALGLKHPGHYGSGDHGPYLPVAEDVTSNTLMSYHEDSPDTLQPAPYDREALNYLYGPPLGDGRPAGIVSAARQRSGTDGKDLFALNSFEVWQAGNTTLFYSSHGGPATAAESMLDIHGGAGIDTVYIPYRQQATRISQAGDGALKVETAHSLTLIGGSPGQLTITDTLRNVERLQFTDSRIAFDIDGNAGIAYGLLYAGFGSAPDPRLLGPWIDRLDEGASAVTVAGEMLDSYAGGLPLSTVIGALYQHIVGHPPGEAEISGYASLVHRGQTSPAELFATAAATDLNRSHFIGLIGQGIEYSL